MTPGRRERIIILSVLVAVAAVLVGAGVWRLLRGGYLALPLPRDLLAYWGSARLLLQRQDPYDLELLLALERLQGWPGEQPVAAWNPPLLQVLLLPLAAVPFPVATAIWLISNPLLIGLGAICAWRALSRAPHRFASLYVPILAFSFTASIHSVVEGQVTSLVLLGLGAFLLLSAQKREFLAGASSVLWLVQPHLVYLLLPLFLIDAGLKRRWSTLAGFGLALLGLLAIATCLYPGWPAGYLEVLQSQFSPAQYEYLTPTVHSLLYVAFGTTLGRYLWLPILPLAMALYARFCTRLDFAMVLNWAVIASLLTGPFSWSSNHVVLLAPILHVVALALRCPALKRWPVLASLGFVFLYAWWFWAIDYQELPNLAVPLAIAALYGYLSLGAKGDERRGA